MKFSYSLIKKLLPKCPTKQKLVEWLNLHSFETENLPGDAFEVSLPPNRYSDVASHIGIAREVAAVSGLSFKNPWKILVNCPSDKGFVDINIRDAKSCPRYAARYFEVEKVKESPKWIKDALLCCGLKPINNIVDIMNYVMLEVGQPLHAFDADKLASGDKRGRNKPIFIRQARRGEKIKTIDGQKFSLDRGVLLIADKEKPLAIAGIKGGIESSVGPKTKRIIVEAANFNPVIVHKAAKLLKLKTDASLRFGHGLSPVLVQQGLDRATELLLKEKAWLLDSVDIYPKPVGEEIIEFDPAKYEKVIGASVDAKKAKTYFERLGFNIDPPKSKTATPKLLVRIPPWRMDVESEEDLFEEVARLDGYGKLKPRAPLVAATPARQDDALSLMEKVRQIIIGFQLDEVYNSSFAGGKDFPAIQKLLHPSRRMVELENPIAEDRKFLRQSLLPLLLKNAEENNRFFDAVRIFEVGKVFGSSKNGAEENLSLGIVLASKNNPKLVLELKGLVDELMRGLGVDDFLITESGGILRVESNHHVLGIISHAKMGNLHTAFCEIDLKKTMVFTEEAKEFIPLRKFPAVVRDISILVSPEARIGSIVQNIQDANRKLIENVDLVDEYVDPKMAGKQSLTFRVIFQADDRTLTDAEVNGEMQKIVAVLKKEFRAEIR